MIKEAECYDKVGDDTLRCFLCPKRCIIKEGQTGFCKVRENRGGRLYTLIYGETSNQSVDLIEKRGVFHFFPGSQTFSISSIGCSLACPWCQYYSISQAGVGSQVTFEISPKEVVDLAKKYGASSICYTHNEPTMWYEFVKDVSKLSKGEDIKNVLVTNGYITLEALKGLVGCIDAVHIKVMSFSEGFYRDYCAGELAPVLDASKYLVKNGVHVELSYLVIPLLNDSSEEVGRFIDWVVNELRVDVPVHFARFFPVYKLADRPPTPADTLMGIANTAYEKGLEYVYVNNVFVEGLEDTHCPRCRTLLITRYGSSFVNSNLTGRNECPSCGLKIPIVGKPKVSPPKLY